MEILYFIECRTGCTCCSYDNHYRGPYKSKEDAERRIASFLAPDSKFWPVCSQYSTRGVYSVKETGFEEISDNRIIINEHVFSKSPFVEVDENGLTTLDDYFASQYYLYI